MAAWLLGACSPQKTTVRVFVHGPAHPQPRCAKGKAAAGALHLRGEPIAEATVIFRGSDARQHRTKTGATGWATISLLPGSYQLTVHASGRRLQPGRTFTVKSRADDPQQAESTLHPCISAGRHRYAVGFEKRVTLAARNLCGERWNQATYRWRQLGGPAVSATQVGGRGPSITFTTHPVERLKALPKTPKVLAFSHREAGEYLFELQAKNTSGETSKSLVLVTATTVVGGLTSVAPGARTVFCGDAKGPWDWRLISVPKGWSVTLDRPKSRTPAIVVHPKRAVAVPQSVEIENRHRGLRFSVVVGGWSTVRRDCGRSDCHRSLETHWKTTLHAQSWKRLIDGTLKLERGPAAESCADCHAVGYDPGAQNGGYDDVARQLRIRVPLVPKKGTHAALPQAIKDISGVYCLGCHGPGRLDPPIAEQPGLFGVGICARCHDRPPEQSLVLQWKRSKHAASAPPALNGRGQRAACARCHTAQGAYYQRLAISRPHSSKTAFLNCCETTEPITCQACHNPMRPTAKKQVHLFGAAKTDSGLNIESAGSGAQCLLCHNTLDNPESPATSARSVAPHSPQADVYFGRAGFRLDQDKPTAFEGSITCAKKTKDACVTCHMHTTPEAPGPGDQQLGGHTFMLRIKEKPPTGGGGGPSATKMRVPGRQLIAPCLKCHAQMKDFNDPAKADHDGDGHIGGRQDEVRGLLRSLERALKEAIANRDYRSCADEHGPAVFVARGAQKKIVLVDMHKRDLGDCDGNTHIEREERPFVFPKVDRLLYRAAYNYFIVKRDGSLGLHNYGFTVGLLKHTLQGLKAAHASKTVDEPTAAPAPRAVQGPTAAPGP